MIELTNKYKDRTPEQTIEIIKNFFYRNKLNVKLVENRKTEIDTYSCHLVLYKNHLEILTANGKGMTEIFSLASGYAELYERFCNKITQFTNYYTFKKLKNEISKVTNFIFAPDEKLMTNDDILSFEPLKDAYKLIFPNKAILDSYLSYITDGMPIGLPYINFENPEEQVYLDPRTVRAAIGSVGMAAGNTFEEAANQAISEIYEHEVTIKFYENIQDTYYAINLDKIENPEIKHIINVIRNKGYKLYVLDLSYNFHVPVLVAILMNEYDQSLNTNFGAFPVYDIAIERIFTELYQGIDNYFLTSKLQEPFKDKDLGEIIDSYFGSNATSTPVFPEVIFDRIQYVDSYNKEVFISRDESYQDNSILNKYFIDLNKKLGNKMWIRNYSLDQNIYAIQVITDIDIINNNKFINFIYTSPIIKSTALKFSIFTKKAADIFISNEDLDTKLYYVYQVKDLTNHDGLNQGLGNLLGTIMWTDACNVVQKKDMFFEQSLSDLNVEANNDYSMVYCNTICHSSYKKYYSLHKYINCEKYTNDEIKYIFKTMYNIEITDEDIENYNKQSYLLQKIYFEPLINYYNSLDYSELIASMFIPNLNLRKGENKSG